MFSKRKMEKRICEDMQIISLDLQLDEKEDEESASILAKWDLCLNPIKKKLCVDHRERNGLRC